LTTAGPTLAAAFAMVSLPKHPGQVFCPSPTFPGTSLLISADGTEPVLEKNNGRFPAIT